MVRPRRSLRRFATACLRRQFEAASIAGSRARLKPDGTVHVTYDFDDAAQAEDWLPTGAKLMEWSTFDKLATKPEKSQLEIKGGTLQGIGVGGWLTKLQFRAPMTVRFRYAGHVVEGSAPGIPFCSVRVSMCDDGEGSRINSEEMSGLRVYDAKTRVLSRLQESMDYDWDTFYPIHMVHDGKFVKLTCHTTPIGPSRAARACGATAASGSTATRASRSTTSRSRGRSTPRCSRRRATAGSRRSSPRSRGSTGSRRSRRSPANENLSREVGPGLSARRGAGAIGADVEDGG